MCAKNQGSCSRAGLELGRVSILWGGIRGGRTQPENRNAARKERGLTCRQKVFDDETTRDWERGGLPACGAQPHESNTEGTSQKPLTFGGTRPVNR